MPIENFETRHKAITNDGQIYSYILKYSENLSKLNYFIQEEESIGNEKPKLIDSLIVKDTLLNTIDKLTYYKGFSEYILKSKFYTVATRRNKGIVLRFLKVTYNKDDVYLVMEVKNNSGIDFKINWLVTYSVT